jgi:prolipoprotein diacylglyceryltransferase
MWLVILVLAVCLSVILIMAGAIVIVYCRKRRKVLFNY